MKAAKFWQRKKPGAVPGSVRHMRAAAQPAPLEGSAGATAALGEGTGLQTAAAAAHSATAATQLDMAHATTAASAPGAAVPAPTLATQPHASGAASAAGAAVDSAPEMRTPARLNGHRSRSRSRSGSGSAATAHPVGLGDLPAVPGDCADAPVSPAAAIRLAREAKLARALSVPIVDLGALGVRTQSLLFLMHTAQRS